eukprot:m.53864 g.53864  ORF g.53864 m.53864 type:complete len:339 (-) comp21831_c0_seq1:222-1238(-)
MARSMMVNNMFTVQLHSTISSIGRRILTSGLYRSFATSAATNPSTEGVPEYAYHEPALAGKKVIITGGSGNVGSKLARSFLASGANVHVLDPVEGPVKGVNYTIADLSKRGTWLDEFDDADSIVHLAAVNPYPEATWEEVAKSMDLTGGYKDKGGGKAVPGDDSSLILESSPPLVGTKWDSAGLWMDATPYASAKIQGESLCRVLGQTTKTNFVSIRVGWCQPNENRTNTMSVAGTPTITAEETTAPLPDHLIGDTQFDPEEILSWYRNMWLSNRDAAQIFTRSIVAPFPEHCGGHMVVNGMSNNAGMRWCLKETSKLLGYAPMDDATVDHAFWNQKA